MMTPLHIVLLIHYHSTAAKYSEHDLNHRYSRAVVEYTKNLVDWGLIYQDTDRPSGYRSTNIGQDHIDLLCKIPTPFDGRRN